MPSFAFLSFLSFLFSSLLFPFPFRLYTVGINTQKEDLLVSALLYYLIGAVCIHIFIWIPRRRGNGRAYYLCICDVESLYAYASIGILSSVIFTLSLFVPAFNNQLIDRSIKYCRQGQLEDPDTNGATEISSHSLSFWMREKAITGFDIPSQGENLIHV